MTDDEILRDYALGDRKLEEQAVQIVERSDWGRIALEVKRDGPLVVVTSPAFRGVSIRQRTMAEALVQVPSVLAYWRGHDLFETK